MHGLLLNTDYDWYEFLKARSHPDEVNFWQPSGARTFHATPPGTPVFFRLKSPHNAIAGFGFFARSALLPAWLAWECFGAANGAATFDTMVRKIEKYRRPAERDQAGRYEIGCLMICEPVFFERREWVREPIDWRPQIVPGRRQDLSIGEGARIFRECLERAAARGSQVGEEPKYKRYPLPGRRYGSSILIEPRLGQGTFRIAVIDAYRRRCAVTGERSLPALDAAHIKPYGLCGRHAVPNGLLLRADIHRLFDKGYVTVTPEYRFEVSPRLREDYENGRDYYGLQGRPIVVPDHEHDRPDPELLAWHAENVFT